MKIGVLTGGGDVPGLNPAIKAVVNRVVADDALQGDATLVAKSLAAGPTRSFGTVKKLLATSFDESLESQMELEARGIAASAGTPDGREGIRAFLEKRTPIFSGA